MGGITTTLFQRPRDPQFNNTTLLLSGNFPTNGAQNNTFLDSSSNGFTITRNPSTGPNAPTQGTFSPFSQTGWSNYFAGDTSSFSVPNINFSTNNFTIEGWFWPTSIANTTNFWGTDNGSGTNPKMLMYINGSGNLVVDMGNAGTTQFPLSASASANLQVNAWNHIAVERTGTGTNQFTLYINGTARATGTLGTNISNITAVFNVGYVGEAYGTKFAGYISNFRIVNGSAVYNGNFTPSAAPLSPITNTVLLTCQSNSFIDTNTQVAAKTITITGTPSVQAFSPFVPSGAYTTTAVGGSGYFDGTGDYFSMSDNASFNIGANAFSIELWYYAQATAAERRFISQWATGDKGIILTTENQTPRFYYSLDGTTDNSILSSATPAINQWNHLAVCRSGSTLSMFLNGARVATTTQSGTFFNATGGITIGSGISGAVPMNGYIAGMRSVIGSSQYDATQTSITIPTAPPTAITNTQLLLNFTNAGIVDSTAKNVLETVGNAQISTTQSKFGGSSMYFDGTGDYLIGANSKLYAFQSGNFTVEMWIYPTTVSVTQYLIDTRDPASATSAGIQSGITSAAKLFVYVGTTGVITASTTSISANTWTHVALVKNGSTWTFYINGTADATTGTNSTALTQEFLTIATSSPQRNTTTTDKYSGYIDDIRVTTGVARYTANFNVPTIGFTDR